MTADLLVGVRCEACGEIIPIGITLGPGEWRDGAYEVRCEGDGAAALDQHQAVCEAAA